MKQNVLVSEPAMTYAPPVASACGYPIAQNPFPSVLIDVTSRCNLRCNFCYYQDQSEADLDVNRFREICHSLPAPIIMKLAGGEPTMHPCLPELIRAGVEAGHKVYVCSNGLKYRDSKFMAELHKLNDMAGGFCLGISMDGGTANAHAYEMIAGQDCLKMKIDSFKSLAAHKLGRICLTAIIVRGLNEDVIPQLIDLADTHRNMVRYIHLRNAGKFGKFTDTEPYDLTELKALVARHFSPTQFKPACVGEIFCSEEEAGVCCYRFRPTPRLQISLIEFASKRAAQCPKRGRILLGRNEVVPLFESIRAEL